MPCQPYPKRMRMGASWVHPLLAALCTAKRGSPCRSQDRGPVSSGLRIARTLGAAGLRPTRAGLRLAQTWASKLLSKTAVSGVAVEQSMASALEGFAARLGNAASIRPGVAPALASIARLPTTAAQDMEGGAVAEGRTPEPDTAAVGQPNCSGPCSLLLCTKCVECPAGDPLQPAVSRGAEPCLVPFFNALDRPVAICPAVQDGAEQSHKAAGNQVSMSSDKGQKTGTKECFATREDMGWASTDVEHVLKDFVEFEEGLEVRWPTGPPHGMSPVDALWAMQPVLPSTPPRSSAAAPYQDGKPTQEVAGKFSSNASVTCPGGPPQCDSLLEERSLHKPSGLLSFAVAGLMQVPHPWPCHCPCIS